MMDLRKTTLWLLVAASLLAAGPAWSQTGMWGYSVHICTEAGKCTEGVMNKKGSPVFVSKSKCEDGAQDLVDGLRQMGMVIKYVRCVQL